MADNDHNNENEKDKKEQEQDISDETGSETLESPATPGRARKRKVAPAAAARTRLTGISFASR